jgi:hypothetical protein
VSHVLEVDCRTPQLLIAPAGQAHFWSGIVSEEHDNGEGFQAKGVEPEPDLSPTGFRRGDDFTDIEDVAATAEERQARLAEIKIEIDTEHSRFKVHREAYFRGVIKLGALLIEAKAIVGHGGFMNWVNTNCPFTHQTANNYMVAAAYVAGATTPTRFQRVMNLSEQGMEQAIERWVAGVASRRMAQLEKTGRAEEKAEREARPTRPTRLTDAYRRGTRRRKRRADDFASDTLKAEIEARQQARREADARRREQAELHELGNLNDVRPHHDSSGLVIESRHSDDIRKVMFVWLSDYAHADASYETMERTGAHWSGQAALTFHYIILEHVYEDNRPRRNVGAFDGRWEEVVDAVLRMTKGALRIDRLQPLDRDPVRSEILEDWAFSINERRTRRSPYRAKAGRATSAAALRTRLAPSGMMPALS